MAPWAVPSLFVAITVMVNGLAAKSTPFGVPLITPVSAFIVIAEPTGSPKIA